MISKDDVRKLAALARMKLEPEEEEKLAADMENILGYVEQIQHVSAATGALEKTRNVLRDDDHPHKSGAYTEAIMAEVPAREGEYLRVKKILG